MNVIQEEFLLLAERLKLDTQFLSQEFRVESLEFVVKALESKLNTFLTQDLGQIYVGPYTANWQYDKISIKRLSNSELKTIEGVYKNLFLPDRQIKFIGVDLDDCLYDVTPIRHLVEMQGLSVESLGLNLLMRDPELCALYKPYEGVRKTLERLMKSGDFIVGILTNGFSQFQRDKLNLLGLKEGEHFNFVIVSEDIGDCKPSRRFFELATKIASQYTKGPLQKEECLILEDKVKNISGADGWLKVQFLKGYHSNIPPANVEEIPKYGITEFSILPDLINLEKDSDFQAVAGSCFIPKSLLLWRQGET